MKTGAVVTPQKDLFFKVEGIHCAACVDKVSRALEGAKICDSFWVDRATNVVRMRKGHVGLSDNDFVQRISAVLKKAGYPARLIDNPTGAGRNDWFWQLIFSGLGLTLSYFIIPHESVPFERGRLLWLFLVSVLFYLSFKDFFKRAFYSLRVIQFTIDTLVSLGAGAAMVLSYALIIGQVPGHLYLVEAFAILFLVSLGHYIENFVLLKADKTLRSLMVLVPPKAHRVNGLSSIEEVLASELQIGDIVLVRPGDRIPVDGIISHGKSDFDESILTGESMPVSKGMGDMLYSGTLNISGNVKFTVQKLGKDMLLSQIIDTVIRVRQTRADIQKFADRLSNVFVPVVVLIALTSFFLWLFLPDSMNHVAQSVGHFFNLHFMKSESTFWTAFSSALGVLVISCPCAMGLATPAALMAVSGIAAKKGILIRDGRAIENAEKITHIFFDKTGTLSSGHPVLKDEWKIPSFDGKYIAAVASQSKHPMSRSLANLQISTPGASLYSADVEEFPGEGVKALVNGPSTRVEILMGNATFLQRMEVKGLSAAQEFILTEIEKGRSLVYWAQNGILSAVFSFEDDLREGTQALLQNFSTHLKVGILSGDNKRVLINLATQLGLKDGQALGELSPLDKVHVLQSYQKDGAKVAFVGDGINDAPVLQAADLGIAVSSASDLAKQSADIVLLTKDVNAIYQAFQLAKRGIKTIRQNLIWAFAYNVIAIPIAFFGLISPIVCTLAMAFSDFVIVGNSLRVFLLKKNI